MTIQAIEFETPSEAIQHVNASGIGKAILIDGKPMVTSEADCLRLECAGAEFAFLHERELRDDECES